MKALTTNWGPIRVIRFLLGIAVIVKGATDGHALFAFVGGLVALMAILDVGCCGTGSCAVPPSRKKTEKTEQDITYEEVVGTK